MTVPFFDTNRIASPPRSALLREVESVLASGALILGPAVERFEREFAEWCGSEFAVGVANGTDAILLALKALDIGPGDEVIIPAQSASATAMAVLLSGAQIVFCDVDPDHLQIDIAACAQLFTEKTRAVIAVHLYGDCADLQSLASLCSERGVYLVEDCAQAHGTTWSGRRVGNYGVLGCFSFYPTKNLGALGDGGAVVTSDPEIAARLRELRQYGWEPRFCSRQLGYNSRLDEIQAAVLSLKLVCLDKYVAARRELAAHYNELLPNSIRTPRPSRGHSYHLYVIQVDDRDTVRENLRSRNIQTGIHYEWPLCLQPAFSSARNYGACPVAMRSATELLSLPLFPGLTLDEVRFVAAAVRESTD